MTSERWKEVKGVFAAALDRSESERAAYLDEVCAGDKELRLEVESLLASHQQASEFIESSALSTDTFLAGEEEEDPDLGRRIGAYRIEKEIGRGGMGSVYLAVRVDEEFERRVAIKLIRRGMELDFIVRRFRNERQILANLDHPYIARLLDGGTTEDSLPYFIMEYVDGQPIHRYAEDQRLPADERLKLFVKVCEAVQYAHDHQVVHRDLKPGNILVTAAGVPKLLDFGIAKLLDPEIGPQTAESTTGGFRLMTPAYASPEQLRGEYATAASDIYSLGVLLFELLTGRRPERLRHFDQEAQTQLTGNLASIVSKATQEEPEARYASVEDLAVDVTRHLEGHPVSVVPFFDVRTASAEKPPTGPNSIAILPFQTLGVEDKTDEYLGVGMADALITKLSNIRRILVRPTSSVLKYAQGPHDPQIAARELDVHYVLEGRIRRAGERVRVTVQMLRGRDGASLWAGKFDERFTDILNLEDSLSEQLTQALVERLTEEERDLLRKRGTDSPQAYQAYLKGRYYWNSLTEEGLAKALVAFSEALSLDPGFAHAQAGLADYYNWLGVWSVMPPRECYAAAKDAALKALDLDPALAEAHSAHAFVCWIHDRDWEAAERGFERAIELNPDYAPAHQWYSYLLSSVQRHDEAMASMERAQSLDPLSPMMSIVGAFISYNAGRVDRAIEQAQRALRIDPRHFMAHDIFAWAYSQKKMHAEAVTSAEKALALAPGDPVALWTMALTLASAGRHAEAKAFLQQLSELSRSRYISAYYIAVIHAVLGDREAALEWLEKGFENCDSWMVWIAVEPRLDDLRSEPRFKRLKQGMGFSGTVEHRAPLQAPVLTSASAPSTGRWSFWAYALTILAAAVLLATLGESLISRRGPPFQNIKITSLRSNGNARSAAISPNGQYVAYTMDEAGHEAIWIRQAAVAAGVRVLPPTGAIYRSLTFSRDGAYLYYVAYDANDFEHGALYQVPSLGGQAKKLVPDVMSAITLSPDGAHVAFMRSNQIAGQDDLIIASLQGDGERRLAFRKNPDRFGYASAPAWSPDGELIAAAIEKSDSQGHYSNLITIRVSDGQQSELSSQRWQFVEKMVWLGDGSGVLTIAQDAGATFQQIWEILLRGQPRKITNDLTDYVGLSITADSHQLTSLQYQTLANIWVAPDGNAEHATQIVPGAGRYYDLAWTRDGKILYSSDASDTVDLWLRDADGSGAKQLTSGGRRNYSPAASPDGKYVVFHSNRTGNWNIWRMDTDGGNLRALTRDNNDGSNWPQVSTDNKWVIFHHRAPTGAALHLWKVPIDGGDPIEITQHNCLRPAVSPADGRIACWYTEDAAKPHWRVGIFPPGGGQPVKTFEFAPSVSIDSSMHWTQDGRAITYVDNHGGVSNIWSQPVDGAPPHPLTSFKAAQLLSFAWSRDGKLAFSRGILSSEVVLITDVK